MNQVIVIGNVGSDAVKRKGSNDKDFTTFSIATSEKFQDKEGKAKEYVTWHNVVCYGYLAEIAERLALRGQRLCVIGQMFNDVKIDDNGNRNHISYIKAHSLMRN